MTAQKSVKLLQILLVVVICVAATFRFLGVYPGFNQFHSDEGVTYSAAVSMIRNNTLDPLRYDYPALVPTINFLSFKYIFIPVWWAKYVVSHALSFIDGFIPLPLSIHDYKRFFQEEILGPREINALVWGRVTTAFISTISVLGIYFVGKKLFDWKVGLLASMLLALNFRAITNSHIGLPDSYNALFVLLSLYASHRLTKVTTKKSYMFAGIALGLSFATKYQVFVMFPFLVAHMHTILNSRDSWMRRVTNLNPLIAFLCAGITFLLINPYLFVHYDVAFRAIKEVSLKYAMGRNALNLYPLHYWIRHDYGVVTLVLFLLGIGILLFRKRLHFLFLVSYLTPFLFVMLYYSIGGFYVRNFITITPIIILVASYALVTVTESITVKNRVAGVVAFTLLVVLANIPGLPNSLIHTQAYRLDWTYRAILDKARPKLAAGDIVIGHPFDPLPAEIAIKRIPIATESLYSLAEARERNAKYVYINMDWAGGPFYGWMTVSLPETVQYLREKPLQQMRNSYWGLAIEEMMSYVVASAYKPWQAADAALFLIKVPYLENKSFTPYKNYDFTKDSESWHRKDEFDASEGFLQYSQFTGLQIGPGTVRFGIARFSSPTIEVQENFAYHIRGSVSSSESLNIEKRNGFLRIDFYEDAAGQNRISTNISPRYYSGLKELEFTTIAPEGAKYATVSFQAVDSPSVKLFLSNILILKSSQRMQPTEKFIQIPFSDYQDLMYANSHGNL